MSEAYQVPTKDLTPSQRFARGSHEIDMEELAADPSIYLSDIIPEAEEQDVKPVDISPETLRAIDGELSRLYQEADREVESWDEEQAKRAMRSAFIMGYVTRHYDDGHFGERYFKTESPPEPPPPSPKPGPPPPPPPPLP